LFRLVGPDGVPPPLTVRTSSETVVPGLMPARSALPAPATEGEAVDPARPLGRALADAFASYGTRRDAVVVVQATAPGDVTQFLSRDASSGTMGPAPLPSGDVPLAP